jgi:orotate phosphoribosyltransferase-like protein
MIKKVLISKKNSKYFIIRSDKNSKERFSHSMKVKWNARFGKIPTRTIALSIFVCQLCLDSVHSDESIMIDIR